MTPRRRVATLVGVLLLVGLAAGLGWQAGRSKPTEASGPRDDAAAATPPGAAARPDPAGTPMPIRSARPADRPLPPLGTPLRDVYADLRRRADAGEAAAACRLAAELDQCAQVHAQLDGMAEMLDRTSRLPSGLPAEQQAKMQQNLASHSEQLLRQSQACEGMPELASAERVRYWRIAALGGSAEGLRQYASGNVFRGNTLQSLDALKVYRDEAESLALRAAANGDIALQMALASAYSPLHRNRRPSLLAEAVTPDAVRSLAMYLQVREQFRLKPGTAASGPRARGRGSLESELDRTIARLESQLDAGDLARARQQAAELGRTYPPADWRRPPNFMASSGGHAGPANSQAAQCGPM